MNKKMPAKKPVNKRKPELSDFTAAAGAAIENNFLFEAIERGDITAVKKALTRGANINFKDHNNATPLIIAIENKQQAIAHHLLDLKCDINVKKKLNGCNTALHAAIEEGFEDIALRLIDMSADIDVKDIGDRTPVFIAATSGEYKVVDRLISAHAKLDVPAYLHNTALIVLIAKDFQDKSPVDHDMIEKLLKGGANPNYKGEYDWTALMRAAELNDLKSTQLLLDHGARTGLKNMRQQTALDIAKTHKHKNIIELIRNHAIDRDVHGGLKHSIKPLKRIKFKK